jgi:hypothetical protein
MKSPSLLASFRFAFEGVPAAMSDVELREQLRHGFNKDELELLCADLGWDIEGFTDKGKPKPNVALHIINYAKRHSDYERLIRAVRRLRP